MGAGTADERELAVVTGASSGIGRALARRLVERGYDVVMVAEDDELATAASALDSAPPSVTAVRADLATGEGVGRLQEALAELGRPVDVAVLNAGIAHGGAFAHSDLEQDLRLVDLNCRSTVHLAKLLLSPMVARGTGRLLFTSSIAAVAPGPWNAAYAASKAFVHSFAEALRAEVRGTGVSVTTLLPGPTDTEVFERGRMSTTQIARGRKDDPDDVAADALSALLAGREMVVTGPWTNRAQVLASRLLPHQVAARLAGRISRPGSGLH